MSELIAYFTHLEGMGTYVPLEIRAREGALSSDADYQAFQDSAVMKKYEQEYFNIYFHFRNNPDSLITARDWDLVNILSDKKRLWYRVGALMAQTIDEMRGRKYLTDLIAGPSINFIDSYLKLKSESNTF